MAKKKSKFKKFLKKAVPLLIAGLGAAALGRRGGATAANVDSGRGGDSSSAAARVASRVASRVAANKIYQDDIMRGGSGVKFNRRNMYSPNDFGLGPYDGAKKGGRAGKDFGKRGAGKAKRGLGRAFTKGRK